MISENDPDLKKLRAKLDEDAKFKIQICLANGEIVTDHVAYPADTEEDEVLTDLSGKLTANQRPAWVRITDNILVFSQAVSAVTVEAL